MSVLQAGLLNQPSAQVIDGSLPFQRASKNYLTRAITSEGNRRTWTYSCWIKRDDFPAASRQLWGQVSSSDNSATGKWQLYYDSNENLNIHTHSLSHLVTSAKFRDTGWYHVVQTLDTTDSTADNRVRLYINGVELTSFGTRNNPNQNLELGVNTVGNMVIGTADNAKSTYYIDAKMAQCYFIDGAALGPENFGFTDPLTNTWRPKKYNHRTDLYGVTWSSALVGDASGFQSAATAADGFNGKVGTDDNSYAQNNTGSDPSTITFTPVGGIKFNSSIQVYLINNANTVNVNGEGAQSIAQDQWVTVKTGSGTLNTLVFSRASTSGASFGGIRIDGHILIDAQVDNSFYLPMDGNSPIGEDKSGIVTPNNGSIWSNSLTSSSGFRSSEPKTNAFDGNTSSICSAVGSGTITFTSPVTFASNSTIRVFLHGGDHTVTVNGGSDQTISAGSFQTVTYSNSGNATFTMTFHRGGGADTGVRAIEIDGVILTDGQIGNSFTPVNFGSSLELDSPLVTGARPILNTTQGGTQAGVGVFGSKENKYYTVTTANGSVYQFDITSGNNPSLEFIRGATYKFDYSDHTSHGVLFSSTNPDSSTTAYTDGTSTASNVISFTVPHNAPDTLYYYCVNHPTAMNGAISVTTDETKADPYASKCVLALPMVGAQGGTVFNDIAYLIKGSGSSKSFTAFTGNSDGGGTTSTRGSVLYGSSFYTTRGATNANAGDYIERTGDSDLSMGTGDYTIEFWFHPYDYTTNDVLIDTRHPTTDWPTDDNGIMIYINANGDTAMVSDGVQISGSGVVGKNQDNHFALTREGTTERLFVNGNLIGTATGRNNDYNRDRLHLGSSAPNGEGSSGYYNDLRVYKGVAKYTSSFKVGSPNPVVIQDTPTGVSGSSKLTKITDGAVTFDGTGDYLDLPTSTDFGLASGDDFTIECYTYAKSYTGGTSYSEIIRQGTNNAGSDGVYFNINSSGTVEFRMSGTTKTTSGKVNNGAWNHIAVSRSSGTVYISINGVVENFGSVTNSSTTGNFRIGANFETNSFYAGQLSNVRFIKGTALYTSDFTPPSAPLTNVTNTKLLCCQSNTSAGAAPVLGLNDGRIWSDASQTNFLPGTFSNAFDNDASSYAETTATDADAIGSITFDPVIPISSITTFKASSSSNGSNSQNWGFNGGSMTARVCNGVTDLSDLLPGSGNLTSFEVQKTGSGVAAVNEIEINGVRLTNGGGSLTVNGNAAATNFNPFNTDINTIRGQETGYPTWSPLVASTSTLSNGNLKITTQASDYVNDLVTMRTPAGTGKWYWEFVQTARTGTDYTLVGMLPDDNTYKQGLSDIPQNCGGIGLYIGQNGVAYVASGAATAGTTTATFDVGDLLGWAFDAENGTVKCFKNGVPQGTQFTNVRTDTGWTFCVTDYDHTTVSTFEINFGQKPFKFPPPDGYQPLNAANVRPETVIARPDQYVGITTWKGDDQASHVINDLNFNGVPDFVWIKRRDGGAAPHQLYDTVRGETKVIQSSATSSEDTQTSGLIDFVRNGFELGASSMVNGLDGDNSNVPFNYVAWTWKAGGNKGVFNVDDVGYASAAAAGITGLDGTGEMTTAKFLGCSIGTKQGFSIIKYRGLGGGNVKVPHGLSQTPDMVIVKNLDSSVDWAITHSGLPGNRSLRFTTASKDTSGFLGLNKGGLASTYFTINYTDTNLKYVNANNEDYIAYCWHSVPGLQKFGSYNGNNANDGSFVELGFKPAMVLIKRIENSDNWLLYDGNRRPLNVNSRYLRPDSGLGENTGDAEGTGLDFLSNGFKLRSNSSANNASENYIYAAWAEAPTVNLYGGQSNAR